MIESMKVEKGLTNYHRTECKKPKLSPDEEEDVDDDDGVSNVLLSDGTSDRPDTDTDDENDIII
jgi:hypothetical protein